MESLVEVGLRIQIEPVSFNPLTESQQLCVSPLSLVHVTSRGRTPQSRLPHFSHIIFLNLSGVKENKVWNGRNKRQKEEKGRWEVEKKEREVGADAWNFLTFITFLSRTFLTRLSTVLPLLCY